MFKVFTFLAGQMDEGSGFSGKTEDFSQRWMGICAKQRAIKHHFPRVRSGAGKSLGSVSVVFF